MVFIKHETVSADPIAEFGRLYKYLGLPYTDDIQKQIEKFSTVKEKNIQDGIHRDSKSNIFTWKERLTEDEVMKIREGTYEIAKHFYTDEDW